MVSDYYCNKCEKGIEEKEFKFSKRRFGRPLCRDCQAEATPKPHRHREPTKPTPTQEEKELYEALQEIGIHCELQKWDGFKHIDIAVVKAKVNIEVDGAQHNLEVQQALTDLKRTYHSFNKGYVTLRIPNCLVRNKKVIHETADYIADFIDESEEQLDQEFWDD